jgi:hypothetical protein
MERKLVREHLNESIDYKIEKSKTYKRNHSKELVIVTFIDAHIVEFTPLNGKRKDINCIGIKDEFIKDYSPID